MRRIYAVAQFTDEAVTAAADAGASEIIILPCPALPDLVEGYNEIAEPGDPPTDLNAAQALRITAVQDRRAAAILAFSFGGYSLPLTDKTKSDIEGAYQGLQRQDEGATIHWEIADGIFMELNLAGIATLGDAAFAYAQACYSNSKTLADAINAASTAEETYAVDIEVGWPAA